MPSCAWSWSAEIPLECMATMWAARNQVFIGRCVRCITVPAVADVRRPQAPIPLEFPALRPAAGGADEAVASAKRHQMTGARLLVREKRLELLQRHRTIMLEPADHIMNITGIKRQINPPTQNVCLPV